MIAAGLAPVDSIEMASVTEAFLTSLRLFALVESLGGVESLAERGASADDALERRAGEGASGAGPGRLDGATLGGRRGDGRRTSWLT